MYKRQTLYDKDTKKPVKVNGKEVAATAKFTPKEANGEVKVSFTFDASKLGGYSLVAFEKMLDVETGAVIGTHEDITDKDQTVKVKGVKKTPKTTSHTSTPGSGSRDVYKRQVHHNEVGHYETVEVPAWDEIVQRRHQVCFVCGRDKTQDFIDSINNKTYPDFDDETKKDGGYTAENGWPHYSEDYAIYKEMGVNTDDMKDVPPFGLYLSLIHI